MKAKRGREGINQSEDSKQNYSLYESRKQSGNTSVKRSEKREESE